MPPEYRLTLAARRDLGGTWRYTRQGWGLEQADRYIDLFIEAFAGLARWPKSAPSCDHIRPGYRHRTVERQVVCFKIAPSALPWFAFCTGAWMRRGVCRAGR